MEKRRYKENVRIMYELRTLLSSHVRALIEACKIDLSFVSIFVA